MFFHYLKIALRNMWKYKSQTMISLIGLAVGFTCFALATLWIRYEMTYDSFHRNAKNMYVIYRPDAYASSGFSRRTPYPLAAYLKETFPEIADAMILNPVTLFFNVIGEDIEYRTPSIEADSSFFRMTGVKILEGSSDFLIPDSRKLAITQEKARQLFGNGSPIGKTLNIAYREHTICAIVSNMSKHSSYVFDFIKPFDTFPPEGIWRLHRGHTILELLPGTNLKAIEKKLHEHDFGAEKDASITEITIKPITKVLYTDPDIEREVKFRYILIFALSGLLVILCSLFNYLTLFISRFRIRQKELALRVVCGASGGSLVTMLAVEFILTIFFAVVLGGFFTQLLHQQFLALSNISMSLTAIYRELLVYTGGICIISTGAFLLVLILFRRRTLNQSIRQSNNKHVRKMSVIAQLVISTSFAFCTIVILKQLYYLHNSDDLGFSFNNRGSIVVWETVGVDSDVFVGRMPVLSTEDEYNKFLKSENNLIKMLLFVSVICSLICVFGFVSIVSLTCEERRKDIAIRKINGATSGDILGVFAKEYALLLLIGSVIAFTTGYYIMRRWLEQYMLQTNIPVWVYVSIVCVMALVIVFCVGWQVYRASVENPGEVVKME